MVWFTAELYLVECIIIITNTSWEIKKSTCLTNILFIFSFNIFFLVECLISMIASRILLFFLSIFTFSTILWWRVVFGLRLQLSSRMYSDRLTLPIYLIITFEMILLNSKLIDAHFLHLFLIVWRRHSILISVFPVDIVCRSAYFIDTTPNNV